MPQITAVRDRIVNAAEECFACYGVGKTTVEDIAAAAGLSRATVYRSFGGGRDEVILAVLLRDLSRFLDRLATRLGHETSVPDAIVEGVVDAVAFVREAPRVAALLTPEAAGHTQAAVAGGAESVLRLCTDHVRPPRRRRPPRGPATARHHGRGRRRVPFPGHLLDDRHAAGRRVVPRVPAHLHRARPGRER